MIGAAFREMELCVELYSIPTCDELIGCSREIPLYRDPVSNFQRLDYTDQCVFYYEK